MVKLEIKDTQNTKLMIALKGETIRSFSRKIGVSHSFFSQVLSNKKSPSPIIANKIASGLGVKMDEIFLVSLVTKNIEGGGSNEN